MSVSTLLRLSVALLALVLGACEHRTPATPPVTLPTLERPLLALHGDVRSGNVKLPADVVVMRAGIPGVFVLQDGQARFRMVKVGNRTGKQVDILSGLLGNETIIRGDLAPVHDGSPIRDVKRTS
jgi:hypothetical protein